MPKYTLNVDLDDDPTLMAELQAEHAATYHQHRMTLSAWLRSIWRSRLDATKEAQS